LSSSFFTKKKDMSKKIEFEILKCSNCGSDELKIGNGAVKCEKCNSFFFVSR